MWGQAFAGEVAMHMQERECLGGLEIHGETYCTYIYHMYIRKMQGTGKAKGKQKKTKTKTKTIIVGIRTCTYNTLLYIRRLNVYVGVFFGCVQKCKNAAFFSGRKRHLS